MTKISDERIEEMLAGLEGVASGPWYHVKGRGKFHLGWEVGSPDDAVSASPKAEVSAHISRCDPDTIRSILTELQSLRAHNSDSAEPVAVKPLEWSEPTGHGVSPYFWAVGAKTQTIGYRIDWQGYSLNHTDHPGPFKLMGIGSFPTIDEAKTAAQSDYETRIRSALASPPAKEFEITDEMAERACSVQHVGWSLWHSSHKETAIKVMRSALAAALTNRTPDDEVGNG